MIPPETHEFPFSLGPTPGESIHSMTSHTPQTHSHFTETHRAGSSTARSRETSSTASPTAPRKRPRVQSRDQGSFAVGTNSETHARITSGDAFSFYADAGSGITEEPAPSISQQPHTSFVTSPDVHARACAVPKALELPTEPCLPGFRFVPSQPHSVRPPPLSKLTQSDDVEVIALDDDDDDDFIEPPPQDHEAPPIQAGGLGVQALTTTVPEVIDVDDEDALANLQIKQTEHLRLSQTAETKLHVSRGGGLFREQPSGQLEIVDSDEEEEMTQSNRIISRTDGLYTVSNTEPFQSAVTPNHRALTPTGSPASDGNGLDFPILSDFDMGLADVSAPLVPPAQAPALPSLISRENENIASNSTAFVQTPITRWPQPQQGPSPASAPSFPLPSSGFIPSLETFSQTFDAGTVKNPSQHLASTDLAPTSQTGALPLNQDIHNNVMPLRGTSWLNARTPNALLHAQQRIAIARGQAARTPHVTPSSDVYPTPALPSPTPYSYPSANNSSLTGMPPNPAPHNNNPALAVQLSAANEGGMSAEGLRNLVRQNGLTADATEEAETPRELTVSLMPHQRRALHWMQRRESHVETDEEVEAVEERCLGGILADDQGLGKTLSMIALLVSDEGRGDMGSGRKNRISPESDESVDLEKESDGEDEVGYVNINTDDDFVPPDPSESVPWRTLIICPGSVINQWVEELRSRIKTDFHPTVCVYHGPKRERRVHVLKECDVVITTYATLVTEYPKVLKKHPDFERLKKAKLPVPTRKKGPLCRISWNRVVLDEAQHVKNRGTDSWFAVMSLKADKRWCLTGTPIQNSVDDIYSLFCFIRYRFVPNVEAWNMRWKKKLEHTSAAVRERAFKRFQTIVGVVLLRRTKNDTINGSALITLPKRMTEVQSPEFCDKEEEAVYRAVQEKSVLTVNKFLAAGTIAHNYSSVLLVLLRLRQACSHPFLIEYAGMQSRGRHVSQKPGDFALDRYSTTYSMEELEEALELVSGGLSSLSMIDDVPRQRVQAALLPPAKGAAQSTKVSCQYCQKETPWLLASFLACGDVFCSECCTLLRSHRKCLRCRYALETQDVAEGFINADQVRKEVHARSILTENQCNVSITASEFKAWFQLEVIKRRSGAGSETVTPDATDAEVGEDDGEDDDDDDDDDDLELLEKSIVEKKNKSSYGSRIGIDDPETVAQKQKLLKALSQHSTKVRKILDKLNEIRQRDKNEKTLIFSQWTSMLDIIEFHVQLEGHDVCRLDGSMTLSARQKQVELFKTSATNNVFLISLAAGGTGLNLTAASNVIITDVWWNPAVEEQAIDRAHRIGQTKDVKVTRFKMKDTVEERIYALCAKKKEAANGTLGVTGAQSLGRKRLSLEELMYIFGGAARDVAQSARKGSAAAEAAQNILQYQQVGSF